MKGFVDVQYQLTRHLRDPEGQPAPPGVEDRRVNIYRELIFNNVEQFLRTGFPVLYSLLDKATWHAEVRGLLREHRSASPFFHDISAAYVDWLQSRPAADLPVPFAAELAHYERVELVLAIADEQPDWEHIDPEGSLEDQPPALSPLVRCLRYEFPVHTISPSNQPAEAPASPTHLIAYRDQADKVRFIENNALTHVLLETIKHARLPGRVVLEGIAGMLQDADAEQVITAGIEMLERLRKQQVVLGTWKI
ncbi:MAG: DUF2063 domain-containing protein [Gammaproteobacteria bacterium]